MQKSYNAYLSTYQGSQVIAVLHKATFHAPLMHRYHDRNAHFTLQNKIDKVYKIKWTTRITDEPFSGSMGQGLPPLTPPPFSTTFENRTYTFLDMATAMETRLFTIPVVSTIEHIAIAKAFGNWISIIRSQLPVSFSHEITVIAKTPHIVYKNRRLLVQNVGCTFMNVCSHVLILKLHSKMLSFIQLGIFCSRTTYYSRGLTKRQQTVRSMG